MTRDPDWAPPEARELWQSLLHALGDLINVAVPHPLDRPKVIRQFQNLYAVGDRPSYQEFKAYLAELWPPWPTTQKWVREIWRTILKNPHHKFRIREGRMTFHLLDSLATELTRRHGSPPLTWRALDVFTDAVREYEQATLDDPDFERYLAARRELLTAMGTLRGIREARHGWEAVGAWWEMDDMPSHEQVEEWNRLIRRYA